MIIIITIMTINGTIPHQISIGKACSSTEPDTADISWPDMYIQIRAVGNLSAENVLLFINFKLI